MASNSDLLRREGATLTWRASSVRAWGSFLAATVITCLALGLAVVLVGAMAAVEIDWSARIAIAAIFAVLMLVFGALAQLIWRNGQGFHGACAVLADEGLHLHLPRWRSLIHRPEPLRATFAWDQIAGIATRLEAYAPQGMAMLQRPYWLLLHNADPVLLFEDRGIDSAQATRSLEPVARAIAERARGDWFEMPMAEGKGGILGAWFTAPPQDRPDILPPARVEKLKSRTRLTAELGGYAFAIVMLARAVAWMLE